MSFRAQVRASLVELYGEAPDIEQRVDRLMEAMWGMSSSQPPVVESHPQRYSDTTDAHAVVWFPPVATTRLEQSDMPDSVENQKTKFTNDIQTRITHSQETHLLLTDADRAAILRAKADSIDPAP
jgi:hypothetical protein